MSDFTNNLLDWLTANCDLCGGAGQNWMLVAGGGILLYIGMLVIAQRRHTRSWRRRPASF